MAKYLSGRVQRTPQGSLTSDRYTYLDLSQAEPNLGDPLSSYDYPASLPVGSQYQVVSVAGYPGQRFWVPVGGGLIPGGITVYDEGFIIIPGSISSITQLNFVGSAITAYGYTKPDGSPGSISTIKVFAPGSTGQILFNSNSDFSTSSNLTFASNTLSVIGFGSFSGIVTTGGSNNNGVRVGIAGTNIVDTVSGNLILTANSGITSIPSNLLVSGISSFTNTVSFGSSVGIGTTLPTTNLHISGNMRLSGTIYDYNNNPGTNGQILLKNNFGGLIWTNQSSIQSGAGGTYTQVQFNNSAGLVDGATNFVYDPVNTRVGIGSTLPQYLLDIGNGTVRVTGFTTLSNLYVSGIATFSNTFNIAATTDSTSTTTGALVVSGGIGIAKNLNVGGATTLSSLNVSGLTTTQNLIVTGISTLGFISGTSAYFTGIITSPSANITNLTGTTVTYTSGIITTLSGTTATYTTGNFTAANINTGIVTTISGNNLYYNSGVITSFTSTNATITNINSTGISTLGFITASNAYLSGIVTSTKLNVTGFTTLTTLQISGVSTFGDKILPVNVGTQDIGSSSNYWNNVYATTFVGRIIGIANSSDTVKVTVDTTNTSRYLTFASVSAGYTGALTNTNLTFNPGNQYLGVGVNNPQYTIHANGGSNQDAAFLGNGYGALIFGCDSSGTRYVNTNSTGPIEFRNNSSPTVRIDSSGNLLVATTSASGTANQPLQVSGGAYINGKLGVGVANPTSNFQVSGTSLITGISTFGDKVLPTNSGTQDLGSSSQKWNNVYGNNFIGIFQGTASKADSLSTARTISITGDVLYTSPPFDGTANVSAAGTLSNTGVVAGNYGTQTGIVTFTVDSKGRITGAGTTTLNASAVNAAGSNTQLQFNDNGVFGANSNLTFNKNTNTLTVTGNSYVSGNDYVTGILTTNTLVATGIVTTNQLAVTGITTVYNKILPGGTTQTIDIGSSSQRWNNIYATNVDATTFNGTFQGTASYATTATNVIGGIGSITQLQVTGISTFTNGPVLIGGGTATGTASQPLQVTGGAYVSGYVGIGITNPAQKFHLASNGAAIALIESTTNYDGNIRVKNTGAYYLIGMLGSPGSTNLSFYDVNASQSRAVIDSSGNFGINTTNPQYKLDVYGNGHYTGNLTVDGTINATISGTINQITVTSDTASSSANYLTFASGSTTGSYGLKDSSNLAYIPLSGNLGIGTNSPVKKLHLQTSFVSGAARGGGFTQALFESNNATVSYWEFQANSSTTNDILFSKGNTGSYGLVGYDHSTDALRFYSNSAERARFDSSGNLLPQGTSGTLNLGGVSNKWNTVYANTFNGTLQGTADVATYAINAGIATNLGSISSQNWQVPYQSQANTTLFTTGGSTGQLLSFNSTSAPTWISPTGLSVGYAATAGVSTNLSGTTTNSIPYQLAPSTTTYLSPPSSGSTYILTSSGGAPSWSTTIPSSTVAAGSNTQVQYNNGGSLGASANFTFNSGTNLLAVTAIKPGQIQDSSGGTGSSNYVLTASGSGGWSWQPVTSVGAIKGITVQQGGITQGTAGIITTLNFSGATVTTSTSTATITISAGGVSAVNQTGYTCTNPITVSGTAINISSASNAYGTRYIQSTAPASACDGDIWYDTSGGGSNSFSNVIFTNYSETINVIGNTGTAATINLTNGNFVTATLTGNCTFTFTTGITSGAISFTLLLTNDGTSGRSIAWPTSVVWPGGTVPNRTTTANKTDVYTFFTINNGTTWYGNLAQYNY